MGNILEASLKIALEQISKVGVLPNYNLIFQVYDEQVSFFFILIGFLLHLRTNY